MQAIILSQGNELTTGQTTDTNSQWLAERLWALGIEVIRCVTVPDDRAAIVEVLRDATRARWVVCTGGLGPTRDDLTAEAASEAFDLPLSESPAALAQIEERYRSRNRTMVDSNRKQALLPSEAMVLENDHGTAPGFAIDRDQSTLFFLPGVPREMKPMFDRHIEPRVRKGLDRPPPSRHIIRTIGVPESVLEEKLRTVRGDDFSIGFRTHLPENQVKLRFDGTTSPERRQEVLTHVVDTIGRGVFGVDSGDLAEVTGALLADRRQTLALAESCTAGRLAMWVASVPGASQYLLEGSVVYSNAAKVRSCNVSTTVLEEHGAVSEPVARALAEGIRARAGASWGVGITGIAGPGGGTPDKPVGTVHIAVANEQETVHRHLRLPGDRELVQKLAAGGALELLRRQVVSTDAV